MCERSIYKVPLQPLNNVDGGAPNFLTKAIEGNYIKQLLMTWKLQTLIFIAVTDAQKADGGKKCCFLPLEAQNRSWLEGLEEPPEMFKIWWVCLEMVVVLVKNAPDVLRRSPLSVERWSASSPAKPGQRGRELLNWNIAHGSRTEKICCFSEN